MSHVYLAGFGLASGMGANLTQALHRLHQPPTTQQRTLKEFDRPIPYHAIAHAPNHAPDHAANQPAATWHARCETLLRQVAAEAGATVRSGALYLASSSLNAGALENGASGEVPLPDLLAELAGMLDWQGPVHWINTACTSSLTAILAARQAMLAGCIDEALIVDLELENRLTLAGFAGMQLLSDQSSKPFAADRNGLVLGEAVAALRLSRQPGRWRIAGGAQVIDSSEVSGASVGAYRSMLTQALANAELNAEQIDLIKVQAAGSMPNDVIEAHALREFFAPVPPLLSLKPLIGHTLGASGAAEIALLLALLEKGQWPDIAFEPDAALGVRLAAEMPERRRHILACILGFGGSHSCIAIEDTGA